MNKLTDIIIYLYANYPHKDELSKARLVKLIYLSDWRNSILNGRQISNIRWTFNHYGPYVPDIISHIRNDNRFSIRITKNYYGSPKEVITLKPGSYSINLTNEDKGILDFVIKQTSTLYWQQFIDLVYDTYPIRKMPRYSILNLPELAKQYRNLMNEGSTMTNIV